MFTDGDETMESGILLPKENNVPRIPAEARVVSKRIYTSGDMGDTSITSSYYITFEFSFGDIKEFCVPV